MTPVLKTSRRLVYSFTKTSVFPCYLMKCSEPSFKPENIEITSKKNKKKNIGRP